MCIGQLRGVAPNRLFNKYVPLFKGNIFNLKTKVFIKQKFFLDKF